MIALHLLPYDSCIGIANGAVNANVMMVMSSTEICLFYSEAYCITVCLPW